MNEGIDNRNEDVCRDANHVDVEKMLAVIESFRDYHFPAGEQSEFASGVRHGFKHVIAMAMEGRFQY